MSNNQQSVNGKGGLHHLRFGLVVLLGLVSQAVCGEPSLSFDQIAAVELDALEKGAQVQQQINALDDRRLDATVQYRRVLDQNSNLEKYNDQLRVTIQSQQQEISSINEQISRISHLERDIVPLMSDMLDALATFTTLDIPFLFDERQRRIEKLRELFANAKISNAEKYRRILEGYQIENDYGRSVEAYDGSVLYGESSDKQYVTFLKVGRVAFLYQTRDGKKSFRWDHQKKAWFALPDKYNTSISEGIRMAREQIPSNLMFVPVLATEASVNF